MDSNTVELQLAAACDAGDADEILRLLGATTLKNTAEPAQSSNDSTERTAEKFASLGGTPKPLTATAKEFVPAVQMPRVVDQSGDIDVAEYSDYDTMHNDYNDAFANNHTFPVYTGGPVNRGTQEMFAADPNGAVLDADGKARYTAAVQAFDSDFPALGGDSAKGSVSAVPTVVADTSNPLVAKMRLERLQKLFGWVNSTTVQRTLEACNGSLTAAETTLRASYPQPAWWVEQERQRVKNAAKAAAAARVAPRRTHDMGARWVSTGDSVRSLYESLREEAGVEARARNAAFDRARGAMQRGDRAGAARFGAIGREANERMKALHARAANAIFEARNPPEAAARGLVDLHGLHVAEALDRLPDAVQVVSAKCSTARILTGSGHHTKGTGKARLRPAVRGWLENEGYRYEEVVDKNSHVGAFIVHL